MNFVNDVDKFNIAVNAFKQNVVDTSLTLSALLTIATTYSQQSNGVGQTFLQNYSMENQIAYWNSLGFNAYLLAYQTTASNPVTNPYGWWRVYVTSGSSQNSGATLWGATSFSYDVADPNILRVNSDPDNVICEDQDYGNNIGQFQLNVPVPIGSGAFFQSNDGINYNTGYIVNQQAYIKNH